MQAAFNIQLQGFPAANRDATVRLVHEATGAVVERRPFLDGSLLVRDLNPGFYELEVRHPNLVTPIERRRVRLFEQPAPTTIFVPVPADLFRDTPIRDIPDADLRPVQQTAADARTRLQPIAAKAPGEVIRAADWNTLVGAVNDLAGAVAELTRMVSPTGHDHAEIAEKFGEVQENLRRFAEAFGRSLLELRREIETQNLRRNVAEVLEAGNATPEIRDRVIGRVRELERAVQVETPVFTGRLAATGSVLLNEINQIAVAQGTGADQFLARPEVQALTGIARHYAEAGTQTRPESELQTYMRTTTAAGGQKLGNLLSGGGR